jgi:hypothetical protein
MPRDLILHARVRALPRPSADWTATVPAGWTSAGPATTFVRGEPLGPDPPVDPYVPRPVIRRRAADARPRGWPDRRGARRPSAGLAALPGTRGGPRRAGGRSRDHRAGQGHVRRRARRRRAEFGALVPSALFPVLDSFAFGSPDAPRTVWRRAPVTPRTGPRPAGGTSARAAVGDQVGHVNGPRILDPVWTSFAGTKRGRASTHRLGPQRVGAHG